MGKTLVSLRLLSESLSPDEIHASLGISADRSWHKGDVREGTSIVERRHGFELRSGCADDVPLEEQVEVLLRRVAPVAEAIRSLGLTHVQLTCIVYASSVPEVHFSPSIIERLNGLGASIDVDLYVTNGNWGD